MVAVVRPRYTERRRPSGDTLSRYLVNIDDRFASALRALDLEPTPEQLAAFAAFEEALYAQNAVMNLTRVPREEAWLRHFIDSLLFQDLIPGGASVLDLGTGPGFPSWPLACARPDLQVTALDSSGKMLGFLRTQPLPNLEIVQARAEEWGRRDALDVVTGRAVAPLPIQMELSAPALRLGGAFIPMRTPADDLKEPNAAHLGLHFDSSYERGLPETDIVRLFPVWIKERPTAAKYPRRWSEMKLKPLVAK